MSLSRHIENGFAIPPSEGSYGLIAFASVPKTEEFEFSQEFVLPVTTVTVFVPEGVTSKSDKATDLGLQAIQNFNFQIYELGSVTAGETVTVSVSGTPKESDNRLRAGRNHFESKPFDRRRCDGIALILAGAWMYLRDRNRAEERPGDQAEGNEFDSSEDVIDAIIALDDLHRAQKISDEAYQKRRGELKEILKGMM